MRERIKMQDKLRSAFKDTPERFRNTVNNAITEAVQFKHRTKKAVKESKENK